MTPPSSPSADAATGGVTPERYAAFIRQIELAAVWLSGAGIQNHHGPVTPERAVASIDTEAQWQPREGGFQAFHHYRLRLEAAETLLAEIDVTFGLDYRSGIPMSDDLFEVFEEVNLPVNTWPYVREFVATACGRMNWQPFTLPALKRGTGPDRPKARAAPLPRPPRRRAKSAPPAGAEDTL